MHVVGDSRGAYEAALRCLGEVEQVDLEGDGPWRSKYLDLVAMMVTTAGAAIKQRGFGESELVEVLGRVFDALWHAYPVPGSDTYEQRKGWWEQVYGGESHVAIPLRRMLHFMRLVSTDEGLQPLVGATLRAIDEAAEQGLKFGLVGQIEEQEMETAMVAYRRWRKLMAEKPESLDHQVTMMSRCLGRAIWGGTVGECD